MADRPRHASPAPGRAIITTNVPAEIRRELRTRARRDGITVAELLRRMVARELQRQPS